MSRRGRRRWNACWRDPDERRDLADRGLRRARTEFAWSVVARRHVEFFDQLVAGS